MHILPSRTPHCNHRVTDHESWQIFEQCRAVEVIKYCYRRAGDWRPGKYSAGRISSALKKSLGFETCGCNYTCLIFKYIYRLTWLRHQMETFSVSLVLCVRNSLVTGEFPSQRPVTRGFDVFFDLRLNKRWSKHPRRRWFETQSRSLL